MGSATSWSAIWGSVTWQRNRMGSPIRVPLVKRAAFLFPPRRGRWSLPDRRHQLRPCFQRFCVSKCCCASHPSGSRLWGGSGCPPDLPHPCPALAGPRKPSGLLTVSNQRSQVPWLIVQPHLAHGRCSSVRRLSLSSRRTAVQSGTKALHQPHILAPPSSSIF